MDGSQVGSGMDYDSQRSTQDMDAKTATEKKEQRALTPINRDWWIITSVLFASVIICTAVVLALCREGVTNDVFL